MQHRFRQALLSQGTEWNPTEAARLAGYSNPEKQSSRLLNNVEFRAILDDEIDKSLDASRQYYKSCVARELLTICKATVGDYFDDEGDIDIEKVKEKNAGAVKEYRRDKNGVSFKLHDKLAAMEKLIRLLNLAPADKGGGISDLSGLIAELVNAAKAKE